PAIIKRVLDERKAGQLAVLVSDFILAGGADQSWATAQTAVRSAIYAHKEKHLGLGVMIFRLQSDYNGKYYHTAGNMPFAGQRPYFLWIMGDESALAALRDAKVLGKLAGKDVQSWAQQAGEIKVKAFVINQSGDFDMSSSDRERRAISNLALRNGKATFKVAADFAPLLLDDAYLCNPANYALNERMGYEVAAVERVTGKPYTHVLTISAPRVAAGQLDIRLLNRLPEWHRQHSDDQGGPLTPATANKTVGWEALAQAVFDAYNPDGESTMTTISISINQ
ncbi:MAG: hypothetical protein HUK09_09290, partial [Bacteroidaceae bacterium]|nr:hypothetical protein [Bacteroidaceae bacterium]